MQSCNRSAELDEAMQHGSAANLVMKSIAPGNGWSASRKRAKVEVQVVEETRGKAAPRAGLDRGRNL
jgi:hypothetical protein